MKNLSGLFDQAAGLLPRDSQIGLPLLLLGALIVGLFALHSYRKYSSEGWGRRA